ncbi:MAG TPA: CpsB/CapC family capsule biosynthesis tyrosine phosphatase [Solirubrobacteraceae bacterium]|jgi:protein-tyrosine phosphatase|nr:CpsB/CapC family capsule biosynthesis tyrosine phosphatase [Solirubrobacteraceae bacterium]
MIDTHSHVLFGIDDGPADMEGSLALARAALAAGTRTLLATPHVSWRYPNDADTIARVLRELDRGLSEHGFPLEVLPGAEVAITRAVDMEPAELSRLGLAGGSWLLLESPFAPVASGLDVVVFDLQRRGHRILLAHPERCPAFQRDRSMLDRLVRSGVLTSVTAGAFVGRFGPEARRLAGELVREEMIHNVASDAHDAEHRPPGVLHELEDAGLGPLASWLTEEVPGAILRDETPPPRPEVELPAFAPPREPRWRRGLLRRA